MKTIVITTHLDAPSDRIWTEANKIHLLMFVAHPILCFEPVEPAELPDRWEEGEHIFRLRLFGFLPLGNHVVSISRPPAKGGLKFLRDNGYSSWIRRWDHLVTVQADGDGTRYTDRVVLDAGALTPIVAAFAKRFYSHRQRRWRRLVKMNFDYADA